MVNPYVAPARAGDGDQQEPPLPLSLEDRAVMTLQERSELVLSFARVLHVNGQSTEETMAAGERCRATADDPAVKVKGGGAAAGRGSGRRQGWRGSGVLRGQFLAGPRRSVPLHDSGPGAAPPQWHDRPLYSAHPSRSLTTGLRGPCHSGDLGWTAPWAWTSPRVLTGG